MPCSTKIVVFDLDETLGYFMELGMFWDSLKEYVKYKQLKLTTDQKLFNNVLELYPEFLRPDIIEILNYIKQKKQKNNCHKLLIYTNNQGPVEWAKYIITYFETKINSKLFDQIIAAFKVRGKRVEVCRTTHSKTHSDLIKCTKIPEESEVCFLDDVFYPDMANEKVYYINLKPYVYDLDFNLMITRFLSSNIIGLKIDNPTEFKTFMLGFMKKYNHIYVKKTEETQNIDKILSKKILQHLHIFFKRNNEKKSNGKKTKRNLTDIIKKNKTHKNYKYKN